ncbi:MAG: excinuclease ABC subunit UvrC [Beijerinckiaceae bacterium]|nr:excinuclease ABC subunit UvrC [Beijerinckiaceae bacterium]
MEGDLPEDLDGDIEVEEGPPVPDDDPDIGLSALPERLKAGTEVIAGFARTLPNAPGVYRMFDAAGDVLYIGKARNLKKRVGQYAAGRAHTNAVARMIAETAQMEFVTTGTETEALLLESNLIKQLRPRYNVLLRDDKSFPYILLTGDHAAPQITKHRGSRQRKGDYFGPFASAWAVKRTIDALQKAFLLRSCSDSFYDNRTRPCLLFQIKRCAAPCTGEISLADYGKLADEARDFLSGRASGVKQELARRMQQASEDLEFETAARYRDRLAALSAVTSSQDINTQDVEEADVFAIDEQAGQFCVEIFFFRNFQNWGNRALFPRADRNLPVPEVLASIIAQFYDDKPAPRLVLISHEIEDSDLLAAALGARMGHKVEVACPKRGEKRDLVEMALKNAREALGRKLADTTAQTKLLAALGVAFGLDKPPRRVEVYDNSHIMGTNAVGGMVVAGPDGFMKTHYRTFNISTDTTAGDDYGMMREVLTRRFSRLVKERAASAVTDLAAAQTGGVDTSLQAQPSNPEDRAADAGSLRAARDDGESADPAAFPSAPDLVIIDGGKGQLEAARAVMTELRLLDIPLVAIAKGEDRNAGRETFFAPGREPFKLPPRDPALYFIQRLRDEAHRFAIGSHRAKRKRDTMTNPLDEIAGIGPTRKRALLLHFGTLKAIQRASLEDLAKAPGVNLATARAVHNHFHEG